MCPKVRKTLAQTSATSHQGQERVKRVRLPGTKCQMVSTGSLQAKLEKTPQDNVAMWTTHNDSPRLLYLRRGGMILELTYRLNEIICSPREIKTLEIMIRIQWYCSAPYSIHYRVFSECFMLTIIQEPLLVPFLQMGKLRPSVRWQSQASNPSYRSPSLRTCTADSTAEFSLP